MGLILLKVEALEVKILRQPHGQLFVTFWLFWPLLTPVSLKIIKQH
jgi:hypothetical protein